MRVLRLIKGVTRRNRIRNAQIREELNVIPLLEGFNKALEKRGISIKEVEESKIYERRGEWRNLVQDSPADRL